GSPGTPPVRPGPGGSQTTARTASVGSGGGSRPGLCERPSGTANPPLIPSARPPLSTTSKTLRRPPPPRPPGPSTVWPRCEIREGSEREIPLPDRVWDRRATLRPRARPRRPGNVHPHSYNAARPRFVAEIFSAHQVQHDTSTLRRGAMLEQIDALPS